MEKLEVKILGYMVRGIKLELIYLPQMSSKYSIRTGRTMLDSFDNEEKATIYFNGVKEGIEIGYNQKGGE